MEVSHSLNSIGDRTFIEFNIRNASSTSIVLDNPDGLSIETLKEGEWTNFRTLDCPCGASCAPPRKDFTLAPKEVHEKSWNMKEEWCGPQSSGLTRPETFSEQAKKGRYRLAITYSSSTSGRQTKYYEFQID